MTRAEIITYCLAKLGITDSTATEQAGRFLDARHSMIWNDEDWRQTRYQETVAVAAGTQDVTLGANCEFVKACRWADSFELLPMNDVNALQLNAAGYDASGPVLAFVQLGKDTSGNVIVRLMQKPTEAKNLLVLGKRKVLALGTSDTPPIPGEDMALCEFVMGDLYEWLRQLNKAAYFFQKAGILLQKMKEIERQQAGEICRIIPYQQILEGSAGPDSYNPLG
jgi:hypothetical protein